MAMQQNKKETLVNLIEKTVRKVVREELEYLEEKLMTRSVGVNHSDQEHVINNDSSESKPKSKSNWQEKYSDLYKSMNESFEAGEGKKFKPVPSKNTADILGEDVDLNTADSAGGSGKSVKIDKNNPAYQKVMESITKKNYSKFLL